ncbi:MAG: response regulator [Lachnospiraceae bacterium]|nr:response regulator [Lachnospiraceae bacterium]
MKSLQTRLSIVIAVIMFVTTSSLMFTAMYRNRMVLDQDSDEILLRSAAYYVCHTDDNFRSAEQSVHSIYNYAKKRAEAHGNFLSDETEREIFTGEIYELGKSIAVNTRGAMAVYLRYNPDEIGPREGFWYALDGRSGMWVSAQPTDMSLYEKDDLEHVGWYYVPVEAGAPIWMDPYFNKNLGVEMISYIIPYYKDDRTVGIIGMDIDMQLLRDAVSKIVVYDGGEAFLITKTGDIIYHRDHPDGSAFNALSDAEKSYFRGILDLERNQVEWYNPNGNGPEKVILKELRNGMILGIAVPRSVIARPQIRLVFRLFITSLTIIIIAILVGIMWVRSVTRPLRRMTDVADRYAVRDFSEKMTVNSNDEVGKLSKSLQEMSASLQKQIEIADSANKAKSTFLSNMSHEIRTPINAILGMNEMVLRESKEEGTLLYSENIKKAGNTLLGIVNDVLDFSKIEAGKIEIIPVDYDLSSVINDLVNMVRIRADEKGLDLELDIDSNIPRILNGDEIRIKQIITNILTNAVKYTEKGKVTFCVGYSKTEEPDEILLRVSVIDTGIGIREEDMGKLFTKFDRIDEASHRNIEGTGLGMSITRSLLKLMGSDLNVKSRYGEGSDFSFNLKQKVVKWEPMGDFDANYSRSMEERQKHTAAFTAQNARVLMVDDNTMNLLVFKSLIKQTKVRVDTALSGDECLKKCAATKYDMIFLDHMMPGKDGIETLHELRAMQDRPNSDTPVICLTANAISGARESYIKEGFDEYLTKPIDTDKLEKMLYEFLPQDKIDDPEQDGILEFAAAGEDEDFDRRNADAQKSLEALSSQTLIDPQAGLKNCGDAEIYLSIMELFYDSMDDSIRELTSYKDVNDLADYEVKVHSLKSSARTIGAAALGEKALKLEMAGKSSDADFIRENHEDFVKDCLEVKEVLARIFGQER